MDPLITYEQVVEDYGPDVAERVLEYRSHNHNDAGHPCWTSEVFKSLLGIIRYEDERGEGGQDQ